MITLVSILSLCAAAAASQLTLTAQLFQLQGESKVNNAKLAWDISMDIVGSYQVQRACSGSSFTTISIVTGNTFDDYDLDTSEACQYRIVTSSITSNTASVVPFEEMAEYQNYDNTQVSALSIKSSIQSSGVYYQYNYITGSDGYFYIQQQTSRDGYNFEGNKTVISSTTICAPINTTCHLERMTFLQHPDTGVVVMWAHLENDVNYDLAQVACAYGNPGEAFNFCGTYRPLEHDSRDLTFWADDEANDYTGYLFSATDTNTNVNIYKLTSNWTAIESLANTVLVKQYREAPGVVKFGGSYYLFTSRAAGWYPSEPFVIATTNISSTWTSPEVPGDAATYCSQSGSITTINGSYAMLSDRYSANWDPPAGANRELLLPLSFAEDQNQYTRYHYYKTVKYAAQDTSAASGMAQIFGVQTGEILSVAKPLIAEPAGGSNLTAANDGVDNNPDAYFTPPSIPFSLVVDLEDIYQITQVDLAVRMYQGSETYYQYTVIASNDNSTYAVIANAENNTDVGFNAQFPTGQYRYVGVNVTRVINTHNSNEADWARGVRELTVYGRSTSID